MEHETHDDDDDGLKDGHDDDEDDDEDNYEDDDEDDCEGVDNHDGNHDGNEEANVLVMMVASFLDNSAAQLISPPQQTMQLHTWNNIEIQIQIHDNSGKAG